ncbi:ATP-grasp domain-containing protein [Flavobacterium amniphilum]|uniref:ATP-grasp domain-containing protein n=1 Tax=Flavobacterium amniphilum TaxID=1834035 RepID=UPI002029D193|nr:ATP-grasp domain-containing protein [Flavobacterium amniphilum]MCL9806279.1 ATP-grasp domain-containing protein [Flavobacterium amniphilum]
MYIALLTCKNLPDLLPADQQLIPLLANYNIKAVPAVWDDKSIDWTQFDYLVFRNTWDYFEKETAFNNWLEHIENLNIKCLNSIEVIKQNKHKFYLRELEKQGIKIIPTVFIDKTEQLNLSAIIPSHWQKAVIKPAFSGGAYQTAVFEKKDLENINQEYKTIASEKELLLQEFIPEIHSLGETSFIFFNKKFSHCINKKPLEGDFRIQVQYGGKYSLINPDNQLIAKAQKVVETFQSDLLYARVDGIIMDGELHLMEIECIEPDLYFNLSEGAHERFLQSILELIH